MFKQITTFSIALCYSIALSPLLKGIVDNLNAQHKNQSVLLSSTHIIRKSYIDFSIPVKTSIDVKQQCPNDMIEIEGEYCEAVIHTCKTWISKSKDRCAEFYEKTKCVGNKTYKHFCIDKFEWPNLEGAFPNVAMTWFEAKKLCESVGKRLPTADEWTFACEGKDNKPYPTGFLRDKSKCNYDRQQINPDFDAYINLQTRETEIKRLDQRIVSNNNSQCISDFGVINMTGNVDEWVYNERGTEVLSDSNHGYVSGLKGGHWLAVRNRCRPITATHNMWHHQYSIGFRCAKEI